MFERFTNDAREAVVKAQEEARTLRHDRITSGHVLLGVLGPLGGAGGRALRAHDLTPALLRPLVAREVDGLDPDALAAIGIDLEAVRQATEASFGPGALDGGGREARPGHIPFTANAKKALELSLRVAIRHRHRSISDGHIVLALLMLPDSSAGRALRAGGVDPDALKETALREIVSPAA
ncbi:hypothetical protein LO762_25630 [Actinocorallia sp. API 0066]|uniref:Clp protease N-terminal domain-containing protein n=1 Tax=Actinocorallia sp. API 0066 TaxID=2896846 RepID=UPI001E44DB7E|nr:Clp protease N-terminal domain-containing protein [Actinocorallia sp. API 0066]MCD0452540.1 hypothetical protein [Actinocorallia sp. API 0066]